MTVEQNLRSQCESISFDRASATFRDAVAITRKLGIRYLWIDALCIIQDSDADWRAESSAMDYVYRNADVTLASEASPRSAIGIEESMRNARAPSSTLAWASVHCVSKDLRGKIYFRVDYDKAAGWTSRGPLSNRGWTLQEEILSPRILRFAKQQVLWKCSSATRCEWRPEEGRQYPYRDFAQTLHQTVQRFPQADPDYEVIPSKDMRKHVLSFWYMGVVNHYVGRLVTYPRDRLMAISGVVEAIQGYLLEPGCKAGI
ncbi:hypothetical protein LTR85_006997 [Meristemomyces frigidus]|nr:hypothetical protein LTR85_006997 [Meristemomyces frigidus]